MKRRAGGGFVAIAAATMALAIGVNASHAASAAEISSSARAALNRLYASNPSAKRLGQKAKGILVFPSIYKAGFIVGGQGGDGAMFKGGKTVGYYRSAAASYGLQAGAQKFGYALFFMTNSALAYLDKSGGWELGSGPSLVVVDEGVGKSLSTTTLTQDVYAYIFTQKGLMAGLGIQGSKITRIHPK
jgi:lipid-binding SYLF domain-containing protein